MAPSYQGHQKHTTNRRHVNTRPPIAIDTCSGHAVAIARLTRYAVRRLADYTCTCESLTARLRHTS
eukprot:15353972-Alexandrium_andersonii.AAC.1